MFFWGVSDVYFSLDRLCLVLLEFAQGFAEVFDALTGGVFERLAKLSLWILLPVG